jgi:hypothetical protein
MAVVDNDNGWSQREGGREGGRERERERERERNDVRLIVSECRALAIEISFTISCNSRIWKLKIKVWSPALKSLTSKRGVGGRPWILLGRD